MMGLANQGVLLQDLLHNVLQLHGFNFLIVKFEIELSAVLPLVLEHLVQVQAVEDLVCVNPLLHDVFGPEF